ncbi:unnamed protein product [Adineta ricciae]|uniref:TIR domain-containing protein n=2 Tax=Adineta ricciae TaxID=249248 RepID=A0A815EIB8_ADIRI|nr:unnamed protein product [Adineta ricciae]
MHGDTMTAMANAIEKSEFVIICMSEAYKQSPYCQAEAHYAFERRRKLIPLVMKSKYKPDGWLGIIVSGKIYVDFTKHQFDLACSMLKTEIEKKQQTESIASKPLAKTTTDLSALCTSSIVPMELPHCIDVWSADHVRSFLVANNFTSLLPVFTDFNGQLLHQAYAMCQLNRETMFHSMKNEVATCEHVLPLTLGTYLHFLNALKQYIPISNSDTAQTPASMICSVM